MLSKSSLVLGGAMATEMYRQHAALHALQISNWSFSPFPAISMISVVRRKPAYSILAPNALAQGPITNIGLGISFCNFSILLPNNLSFIAP